MISSSSFTRPFNSVELNISHFAISISMQFKISYLTLSGGPTFYYLQELLHQVNNGAQLGYPIIKIKNNLIIRFTSTCRPEVNIMLSRAQGIN